MKSIPTFSFVSQRADGILFEIEQIEKKTLLLQSAKFVRRDSFYVIFFIVHGCGEYVVDFNRYMIQPYTIFCIAPGQVHYWDVAEELSGYVLLFPLDFLVSSLDGIHNLPEVFSLFYWDTPAQIILNAVEVERISQLFDVLVNEYQHVEVFQPEMALQSGLLLLLINLQRLFVPSKLPDASAGHNLLRDFFSLIDKHYKETQQVSDYADMLGVTAGHLTNVVTDITGLSALKLIHQRIVLEAKRLLIHTESPASTIAHELSFSDASYFGRFFKREVGQTTKQFRQQFP